VTLIRSFACSVMLLAGATFATATWAQALAIPSDVDAVAKKYITASTLEAPIRFLSSDALEGRGPSTPSDTVTRAYLAAELQGLGYSPAGTNGSYEQLFDVVGITSKLPEAWSFQTKGGAVDLKRWDDFIGSSGVQQPSSSIKDAELVFVGYGIEAPEYKWDDFKGADLKGKVLVMLNNDPDWDPKLFEGNRRLYYGRWSYKYESAARQGAAGVIIVHTTPSAGYPWQVVQTSWSGEQFELPAGPEPRIQLKGWATEPATRRLLDAAGHNLDKLVKAAKSRSFKPVPLGIRTSLSFANEISSVKTGNVAGVLPGSDPQLKSEIVVFSAHHDHLGIGEPDATGDKIYNGAVDNAAGCGQLLAIAKAFAELPQRPRRSTLILFVAAEEQGLLGSQYYAQNPTFPAGKLAANINYDGGNIRGATRDVVLIGLGKSSLDAVAKAVAARQGRTLTGDQFPDRGFYYRSDQFSFAKVGVPALYFDDGTDYVGKPASWGREQEELWEEKQYHQPSDEIDGTWVYDGMIQDAQLGFFSGWLIAQADEMPTWVPGDEFEAARKKALAAVRSGD